VSWEDEARQRLDASTPGPWRVVEGDQVVHADDDGFIWHAHARPGEADADAEFIAHAPDDLRQALDALDQVRRENEQFVAALGDCNDEKDRLTGLLGDANDEMHEVRREKEQLVEALRYYADESQWEKIVHGDNVVTLWLQKRGGPGVARAALASVHEGAET